MFWVECCTRCSIEMCERNAPLPTIHQHMGPEHAKRSHICATRHCKKGDVTAVGLDQGVFNRFLCRRQLAQAQYAPCHA